MLESKVDDELELLGQIRTDVHAIVTRWLGEKPLTLDEVDSLLANIAEEGALPASAVVASAPAPVAIAVAPAPVAAAPAVIASAPALTPAPLSESPLTASVAPLFDSRPPPASVPPPVFESRPASSPPASLTPSVFDDKPEQEDPEAQAQAIVAAFEQPEVDTNSTEALAAELENSLSALEASTRAAQAQSAQSATDVGSYHPPRRERSQGSRRPDLNELLDQPLDALDFERTELEDEEIPAGLTRSSEIPTGAPPPAASGDDFEILVDDEILEIAEDDVEIVNDDEESN